MKIHSDIIRENVRDQYTVRDLNNLEEILKPAVQIDLTPNHLVRAADRMSHAPDPTHYDAVWVRDAAHCYLGMKAQGDREKDAQRLLKRLLDYFATPPQQKRLRQIINTPELVGDPESGAMNCIHIRFDGRSRDLDDVIVGHQPQKWNHKQNDALGLYYQCAIDALVNQEFELSALSPAHWEFIVRLPTYFERVRFYDMEDAGPWEEIERVNTSSIALVTSSLERLNEAMRDDTLKALLSYKAQELSLNFEEETLLSGRLSALIDHGYARILKQLPGGESPDYPPTSAKYREADAALLNVLFPATLARLDRQHKEHVLELITPLIGEIGIKRYIHDSYQAANYWRKEAESQTQSHDSRTDSFSTEESFRSRAVGMASNTEAQWFFDSWLAKIYGILYRDYADDIFLKKETHHFNRALGQVTGGSPEKPVIGADGNPVPHLALPESYNVVIGPDGVSTFAPSPITPLNWAKASMIQAIRQLKLDVESAPQKFAVTRSAAPDKQI